jgi:two-component system chemotaxis response regulator CheY
MGKNIFIVEDLPIMRDLLSTNLESLGHKVVGFAENGKEAIAHYAEHNPDLMTLDISLPDMDGLFVLKEIRLKHPQAKILIVTANDQKMLQKQALAMGASGVLLKPFVIEDVTAALSKVFS